LQTGNREQGEVREAEGVGEPKEVGKGNRNGSDQEQLDTTFFYASIKFIHLMRAESSFIYFPPTSL
jgi:hypothetical protein